MALAETAATAFRGPPGSPSPPRPQPAGADRAPTRSPGRPHGAQPERIHPDEPGFRFGKRERPDHRPQPQEPLGNFGERQRSLLDFGREGERRHPVRSDGRGRQSSTGHDRLRTNRRTARTYRPGLQRQFVVPGERRSGHDALRQSQRHYLGLEQQHRHDGPGGSDDTRGRLHRPGHGEQRLGRLPLCRKPQAGTNRCLQRLVHAPEPGA